MVTFIADINRGSLVEDAPNSLRQIAPYIEVSLRGLSASDESFCELTFRRGVDNAIVKKVVPNAMLRNRGELFCFLANNGFDIPPIAEDEKTLFECLKEMSNTAPKALFAEKLGWLNPKWMKELNLGYIYVTPKKVYGNLPKGLTVRYVENPSTYNQNIDTSGTLQDWIDNIGVYIKCSPILTLGVCMGLGVVAQMPCGIENYIVHLFCETSKGKTIIELVVESLFRKALKNALPSWDITPIGLMDKCSAYSDAILILDEVTKFNGNAKDLQQMIYRAANGSGKITSFAFAKSVHRVDCTWNISILSSGEKAITQIIEEANVKQLKGKEVRCFEINAMRHPKYYSFTSIPKNFEDSASLAKLLERNTGRFYGTPAKTFLKKFMVNIDDSVSLINKKKRKFFKEMGLDNGSIKGRIAERFAYMEAIGILAIKYGILPMERERLRSHIRCLCNEVLEKYKTDAELVSEGLALLKNALKQEYLVKVAQKGKKFSDAEKMAWGYTITRDNNENKHFIAVRKNNFDSLFASRYQAELVTKKLMQEGVLTHKQIDFVAFPDKPQFHCLNLIKLRKLKLYK